LTDQAALAYLAEHDSAQGICEAAIKRLTNQDMLVVIAKNGKFSNIRRKAAEKLTDQTLAQQVFADMAINEESYFVRSEAVKKLTDQKILAHVAKNYVVKRRADDDWRTVLEKLTDQELLFDVATHAKIGAIRVYAATKLTNQLLAQQIIADISQNDEDYDARRLAISELTDLSILRHLATNRYRAMDRQFNVLAKERLDDLELYPMCKGKHSWEYFDSRNYLYGDTMCEDVFYKCKKCGKVEKRPEKSFKW